MTKLEQIQELIDININQFGLERGIEESANRILEIMEQECRNAIIANSQEVEGLDVGAIEMEFMAETQMEVDFFEYCKQKGYQLIKINSNKLK